MAKRVFAFPASILARLAVYCLTELLYALAAFVIDRPLELVTGPLACDWGMNYVEVPE